jgi:hypothetical protein
MILREHLQAIQAERDACARQWPSEAFWRDVHTAAIMKLSQLEPTAMPDMDAIEQTLLADWLDFATEAGTA